jgi:hypothetical protein
MAHSSRPAGKRRPLHPPGDHFPFALALFSHETAQIAQKEMACLVMVGRADWQQRRGGGLKRAEAIDHLSQTTRATGEGKYGACMQAELQGGPP